MEKQIEILRTVFRVNVAVFEFLCTMQKITGSKCMPSKMHLLHLEMREELEKENPDIKTMEDLLKRMEDLAKINSGGT